MMLNCVVHSEKILQRYSTENNNIVCEELKVSFGRLSLQVGPN